MQQWEKGIYNTVLGQKMSPKRQESPTNTTLTSGYTLSSASSPKKTSREDSPNTKTI
jgi:hypothetical protein